jgi:hypothetical protein
MSETNAELVREHTDFCNWSAGGSSYASVSEFDWLDLPLERRRAELETAWLRFPERFSARFGPRPSALSALGKEIEAQSFIAVAQSL